MAGQQPQKAKGRFGLGGGQSCVCCLLNMGIQHWRVILRVEAKRHCRDVEQLIVLIGAGCGAFICPKLSR